jgi:beta-N-acetylhexosaminidase
VQLDRGKYQVDALTDEQLAGQSLMVGFEGQVLDHDLRAMISEMHVGGIILFTRNVSDPPGLVELCEAAQAFSLESGHPPLLIAVDQEGGPVARLGPPFTTFPGNRAMGEAGSERGARDFGAITARELRGVGITMNLAPVLDVIPQGFNAPVIADRVFGDDPEVAALLGKTVIEALQTNGVAATAKHFPGLGRAAVDPHKELPHIDTEQPLLYATDLIPFRTAIESGVAAVMLSHVVYRDLDPLWPASLSSVIAKDLLRKTMGFEGVTMTDDLDMGAIDKHFHVDTLVGRMCHADIDVALICRDRVKVEATYGALLKAIRESRDTRRRRALSVQRVLTLKEGYAY